MVHSYLPGIPIYLSEYNSGLFADLNHDSSFASSYIILSTSDLIQRKVELDIWSYWTFSDIFEEQGWIPTEFHNGFGMITINGVPKPAFALPSSLQEEISGTETIPNHCSRSVPFFLLTCKIL